MVDASGACAISEPSMEALCDGGVTCGRYSIATRAFEDADDDWHDAEREAKEEVTSMVFNAFIWCQLFNMVNARMVEGELNVFSGLHRAPMFVGIWTFIAALQIIIMFFGGPIFKIQNMSGVRWAVSVGIGLVHIPFMFIVRVIAGFVM